MTTAYTGERPASTIEAVLIAVLSLAGTFGPSFYFWVIERTPTTIEGTIGAVVFFATPGIVGGLVQRDRRNKLCVNSAK